MMSIYRYCLKDAKNDDYRGASVNDGREVHHTNTISVSRAILLQQTTYKDDRYALPHDKKARKLHHRQGKKFH